MRSVTHDFLRYINILTYLLICKGNCQKDSVAYMQLRAAKSRCTKRIDERYCIPWPT